MNRARRGPLIADRRLAIAAGFGSFILGAILLHDAYEGHAKDQPVWLRPFSWW